MGGKKSCRPVRQQNCSPACNLLCRLYGSEQWTVTEELIKRKEKIKNVFCQDNLRINNGWMEFNKFIAGELGIVELTLNPLTWKIR